MIFKKLLHGGIDLDFEIELDKEKYKAGETVKGILAIITEKGFKVRKLRLYAEGIEETKMTISDNNGYSSTGSSNSSRSTTRTYVSTFPFFSQDLSSILQHFNDNVLPNENSIQIEGGNKEIPFEFVIPEHAYPSYKGKHAQIKYQVKATADRENRLDINKHAIFSVINSKHKMRTNILSDTESDNENFKDASRRIGQILNDLSMTRSGSINVDIGKLLFPSKDRNHFNNSEDASLDLQYKSSDKGEINFHGNNIAYSPGQMLKGNVIILKDIEYEKVKKLDITLNGMEYAYAQGYEKISRIEKFEYEIRLKDDRKEEMRNDNENTNEDNNKVIPFEIQIPSTINKSYLGRYSEYFWGLEVKVNVAWSSDVYARTIIDIV